MAKKGDKRKLIGLVSEESGERIYYTTKNTMNTPEKLSLKKYSPKLRMHVVFTETKKNLGGSEERRRRTRTPMPGLTVASIRANSSSPTATAIRRCDIQVWP